MPHPDKTPKRNPSAPEHPAQKDYNRLHSLAQKHKHCYEEQCWWNDALAELERMGLARSRVIDKLQEDLGDRYVLGTAPRKKPEFRR